MAFELTTKVRRCHVILWPDIDPRRRAGHPWQSEADNQAHGAGLVYYCMGVDFHASRHPFLNHEMGYMLVA
jgi:hypothetical protein